MHIDYNTYGTHCKGDYVLGHQDVTIKNTMEPRALNCIYLRPSFIIHGKHELYLIETKKITIKRELNLA